MNPAKMPPPDKLQAFAAIRERDRKALVERDGIGIGEAYARVMDAEEKR